MTVPARQPFRGLPPRDFRLPDGSVPEGPGIRALINSSAPNIPPELAARMAEGKSLSDILQSSLLQGGNAQQPTPGIGVGPSGTLDRGKLVLDENGNIVDYGQEGFPVRTFKQEPRTLASGKKSIQELLSAAGSPEPPPESLYRISGNQREYTKSSPPTDRSLTAMFVNSLKSDNPLMVREFSDWWRSLLPDQRNGILTRLVEENASQGSGGSIEQARELPFMVKMIEKTLRTGRLDPTDAAVVRDVSPYESFGGSLTQGQTVFDESGRLEDTGYTQDYAGDLDRAMEDAAAAAEGGVSPESITPGSFEDFIRRNPGPGLPAPGNVSRLDPAAVVKSYTEIGPDGKPISYGTESTVNEEFYDSSKIKELGGTKKGWKDIPYKTSLGTMPASPEAARAYKEAGVRRLMEMGRAEGLPAGSDISSLDDSALDSILQANGLKTAPAGQMAMFQGADAAAVSNRGPKSFIPRKELWNWENAERMGKWFDSDMPHSKLDELQGRFRTGGRQSMVESAEGKKVRDRWLAAKNDDGQWDIVDPNDPAAGLPSGMTDEIRQQLIDAAVEADTQPLVTRTLDGGFELYDRAKHGTDAVTWDMANPTLDMNFSYTGSQNLDAEGGYTDIPLDQWKRYGFDETTPQLNTSVRQNHTVQQRLSDFVRNGIADPSNPDNAYSIARFLFKGRSDINPILDSTSPLRAEDIEDRLEDLASLTMTRLPHMFTDANSRVMQKQALEELFRNAYVDNAPNSLDGRSGRSATKAEWENRLQETNAQMRQEALNRQPSPDAPDVQFPDGADSISGGAPQPFSPGPMWQTTGGQSTGGSGAAVNWDQQWKNQWANMDPSDQSLFQDMYPTAGPLIGKTATYEDWVALNGKFPREREYGLERSPGSMQYKAGERPWWDPSFGGDDDHIIEAMKVVNAHLRGEQVAPDQLSTAERELRDAEYEVGSSPFADQIWDLHGDAIRSLTEKLDNFKAGKPPAPSYTNPGSTLTTTSNSDADGSAKLDAASPAGGTPADAPNTAKWPDPTTPDFNPGEHPYTTGGAKGRNPTTTMLKDLTLKQLRDMKSKRYWSQTGKNGGRWPKDSPQAQAWDKHIADLIAAKEAQEAGGLQQVKGMPAPVDGPEMPFGDHRAAGIADDEMVSEADAASMLGVSTAKLNEVANAQPGALPRYGTSSAPTYHLKDLNTLSHGTQPPAPSPPPQPAPVQQPAAQPQPPGDLTTTSNSDADGSANLNAASGSSVSPATTQVPQTVPSAQPSQPAAQPKPQAPAAQQPQQPQQPPPPPAPKPPAQQPQQQAPVVVPPPATQVVPQVQGAGPVVTQVAPAGQATPQTIPWGTAAKPGSTPATTVTPAAAATATPVKPATQPAAAPAAAGSTTVTQLPRTMAQWAWDQTAGRVYDAGKMAYDHPKTTAGVALGGAVLYGLSQDQDPYGTRGSGRRAGGGPGGPVPEGQQGGEGGSFDRGLIRSNKSWSEMTPEERIRDMRGWYKDKPGLIPQTLQRKS